MGDDGLPVMDKWLGDEAPEILSTVGVSLDSRSCMLWIVCTPVLGQLRLHWGDEETPVDAE